MGIALAVICNYAASTVAHFSFLYSYSKISDPPNFSLGGSFKLNLKWALSFNYSKHPVNDLGSNDVDCAFLGFTHC